MTDKLIKAVLDADTAPVVICDIDHIVRYMNPASISCYKKNLVGQSIKLCHNEKSNDAIDKVLEWFKKDSQNNLVFTYRNEKENKDVYMIALRDEDGQLIGYYEKHEYKNVETRKLYDID